MCSQQLTLIGTQGAGKTVLTTVLAKQLETETKDGLLMYPLDGTSIQINTWMDELQEGRWLPSTPPGRLLKLHWNLHIKDNVIPMWMFDSAGQDLTKLFSRGGYKDDYLSKEDETFVEEHINNATVLLILLNPRNFFPRDNGADKKGIRETVSTVSNTLAFLEEDKKERHIAFILTAWDEYEEKVKAQYGGVEEFVRKELPVLHSLFIKKRAVPVFPVAAVGQTIEGVLSDGSLGRVPVPNFTSTGLEPLFRWITEALVHDWDVQKKLEANEGVLKLYELKIPLIGSATNSQKIQEILDDVQKPLPYPDGATETQIRNWQRIIAKIRAKLEERIAKEKDAVRKQEGEIRKQRIEARQTLIKYSIASIAVIILFCWGFWWHNSQQIRTIKDNAVTRAGKIGVYLMQIQQYEEVSQPELVDSRLALVQKIKNDADEEVEIMRQSSKHPHEHFVKIQNYEKQAEAEMNIAKQNYDGIVNARHSVNQSAQTAEAHAKNARAAALKAQHLDASRAAEKAEDCAKSARELAKKAQETNAPQQYADKAAALAATAEINATTAQNWAEQFRVTRPEIVDAGKFQYCCSITPRTWPEYLDGVKEKLVDREHRVQCDNIKIKNNGGEGYVEIIAECKGRQSSRKLYFGRSKTEVINGLMITKLPNHIHEAPSVNAKVLEQ